MTIGFLLPFRYDTLVWRTDGRTNGRRTMATSTTLCITSRGKNVSSLHIPLLFDVQTVSGKAKAIRKFVIVRCNFKQLLFVCAAPGLDLPWDPTTERRPFIMLAHRHMLPIYVYGLHMWLWLRILRLQCGLRPKTWSSADADKPARRV